MKTTLYARTLHSVLMLALTAVIICIGGGSGMMAQDKSDAIIGQWLDKEGESLIRIYKQDNKFFADLIWVKVETKLKGKPNLKPGPVNEKITFLRDFVFDADDNEWNSGRILDVEGGSEYKGRLKLISKDKLEMRGWVGLPMFGETFEWRRAQ